MTLLDQYALEFLAHLMQRSDFADKTPEHHLEQAVLWAERLLTKRQQIEAEKPELLLIGAQPTPALTLDSDSLAEALALAVERVQEQRAQPMVDGTPNKRSRRNDRLEHTIPQSWPRSRGYPPEAGRGAGRRRGASAVPPSSGGEGRATTGFVRLTMLMLQFAYRTRSYHCKRWLANAFSHALAARGREGVTIINAVCKPEALTAHTLQPAPSPGQKVLRPGPGPPLTREQPDLLTDFLYDNEPAMNLTDLEKQLLLGVIRERDRLAAIDFEGHMPQGTRRQTIQEYVLRWLVEEARQGAIPYDPAAWLGHPLSNAESQSCRRACRRLEKVGLLELVAAGPMAVRVTYVRLTPATEQAARECKKGT